MAEQAAQVVPLEDEEDDDVPWTCEYCGSTETDEVFYEDGHSEFSVNVCAGCGAD